MAGSVRITGPEFNDATSIAAFARIEESIRQFTSHSRENIAIVRNPFAMPSDHFVVMWGKGAAVATFVHHGGKIRGGMNERWSYESRNIPGSQEFDNPVNHVAAARTELISIFQSVASQSVANSKSLAKSIPATESVTAEDPDIEEDPVSEMERLRLEAERTKTRNAGLEHCTRALVILTLPVERIRIDGLEDHKEIGVFSIDQSVNRTIFHMPNVLRVIDFETSFFTPEEITKVTDVLEDRAIAQSQKRPTHHEQKSKPTEGKRQKTNSKLLFVLLGIVLVGVAIYLAVSPSGPAPGPSRDPDTVKVKPIDTTPKTRSIIVLTLPEETQAFISPIQYNTRTELLRAIGAGEGTRMLPQKSQSITFDSIQFAKGVYGYFKVEGTWRRGKLLQTLKARDTVIIENFLPPLP